MRACPRSGGALPPLPPRTRLGKQTGPPEGDQSQPPEARRPWLLSTLSHLSLHRTFLLLYGFQVHKYVIERDVRVCLGENGYFCVLLCTFVTLESLTPRTSTYSIAVEV